MAKICKEISVDEITDYIGGRLSRREVLRIQEHFLSCWECRNETNILLAIQYDIDSSEDPPIPEGAIERIMEDLRIREEAKSKKETESFCARFRNFLKKHFLF